MPLAYFITFSTYGTWLPGTDKGAGSVDRAHNQHLSPFIDPDPERADYIYDRMDQPVYVMDAFRRAIVCQAIIDLCLEKVWKLHATHVRSNHVHSVVTAERDAGRLMSDLKARASRELNSAGIDPVDRKRWTRHGSTLHLFDVETVGAKVRYTVDDQGERMSFFDSRTMEVALEKESRTK